MCVQNFIAILLQKHMAPHNLGASDSIAVLKHSNTADVKTLRYQEKVKL